MKAAYFEKTGGPEVLTYGDLPEPVPGPNQVSIQLMATAVNPIDTYIRAGAIAVTLPMPFVVGADFAGIVTGVGVDGRGYRVGDRVWGSNQGMMGRQGAAAQIICVDEGWVHPLPPGVAFTDAAAGALVGITAHLGLFGRANLQQGETVVATGGSGGVGSSVIQMAKAAGARVIATAGSTSKADACRALGADEVILYKTEDIAQRLADMAPHGVDVWFEVHREPNLEVAITALGKGGRFVAMAGRAAKPVLPFGALYTKDCSIVGFAMFNASQDAQRKSAAQINQWLAAGQFKPRIDRILPLAEMAEAHRLQEASIAGRCELGGKIVLTPM